MNENDAPDAQLWPLAIAYPLVGGPSGMGLVNVRPGMTTLLGPNGSGKTRALRAIKNALPAEGRVALGQRKVHYLSAGRSSPLETFRARSDRPDYINQADAAVGNASYIRQWWDYESVTGDLLALDSRPDLKLKVEARLQQLFDRSVQLKWTQIGMNVRMTSASGGDGYAANHEASGILQIVAMLSAIHNDEIGALLVDEPEISLHPQHQAFLLEEMEAAAGDPSDPKKKLIIAATHAVSMLPLRRVDDLPAIGFFTSARSAPIQLAPDAEVLGRRKLAALVARLGATHRAALFAEHVLLVEGPSDEIVTSQLARRLRLRLLARNVQILPVIGKGEFVEAAKLFRLMGKRVTVLADLDALADDNALVCDFANLPGAAAVANGLGFGSLSELDRDLRNALAKFMSDHEREVDAAAKTYSDWSSGASTADVKRRVTLARILSDPTSFGGGAAGAAGLRSRYDVLLSALEDLGCFVLRRGAIENYYAEIAGGGGGKPASAAIETASFDQQEERVLADRFPEVRKALLHAAPNQLVDEDRLLRLKLGAILTPVLLGMDEDSNDAKLNAIAAGVIGSDAGVFRLANVSTPQALRIEVDLASPLFERDTFPFKIGALDNPTAIVPQVLPGMEDVVRHSKG